VRDFDFSISTPKLHVRVPTSFVSTQFDRMRCASRASRVRRSRARQGCLPILGEFVGKHGGNLDHVVPRDRGGRDSFENLVWSKKGSTRHKANRLPHEAGLRLMRKPQAPKPLPVSATGVRLAIRLAAFPAPLICRAAARRMPRHATSAGPTSHHLSHSLMNTLGTTKPAMTLSLPQSPPVSLADRSVSSDAVLGAIDRRIPAHVFA